MLGMRSEPSCAACARSSPSSTPACQVPGTAESVPQAADSAGTPQWCASSVPRARVRPSSGKLTKLPVRGSAQLCMVECSTGAPGLASCSTTVAATSSADPRAKAPALVAGAVVPSVGMVTHVTGTPASANTSAASMPSLSTTSGEMVPMRSLSTGRRRSSSALPAMTVAISTA